MGNSDTLSPSERRIIVGIDFGTTYSGLAWAETRRPDHIQVVDWWPANIAVRDGSSSVKVPTELRYTKDGYEWGFQIPSVVERHQWFKLALDKKQSLLAPINGNRDAETLTKDYLTAMKNHLTFTLENKLGAAFRTIPLEFVLTVPAIWSEVAKEKTLRACQAAGFKTEVPLSLVSEPEAAAMFSLHALDSHGLKVGDTFVVCDAGGGTVDLISYTITKPSPKLEIKEAAAGTGALCGSTFLNRRFGEFITSKLSREDGWDQDTFAEAMERFDSKIKKEYSPLTYSESGYRITVPGLADNDKIGIKRGRFNMKLSDMEAVFEPVVSRVIELVHDQIASTNVDVKAVLLVGGFGQSSYLKERLRAALAKTDQKIEVLQPPNAWTAVVRGAVMKGLANHDDKLALVHIGPRTARKHYGYSCVRKFNANKHRESSKFWDGYDGCYMADLCVWWFIEKGDPVAESEPTILEVWNRYLVDNGPPTTYSMSFVCDSTSAVSPEQSNDNVVELVRLTASLTSITEPWPQQKGKDDKMYYIVKGQLEVAYESASTKYTFIHKGKRFKTVTAEYV